VCKWSFALRWAPASVDGVVVVALSTRVNAVDASFHDQA
jgi:hypothetical protein